MSFEIGDRVECIEDWQRDGRPTMVGLTGTLVAIRGQTIYGVSFDEPFATGHHLNGHLKGPHGWWLPAQCLRHAVPASARRAKSIGEFFKKQEATECTSSPCCS